MKVNNSKKIYYCIYFKPLNAELNPTCHLLALLGAHHILHVSRIRVNIKVTTPFPCESFCKLSYTRI
jgi:hypothetical protein